MPAEKVARLEQLIAAGDPNRPAAQKARAWIDNYQSEVASSNAQGLGDPYAASGLEAIEQVDESLPASQPPAAESQSMVPELEQATPTQQPVDAIEAAAIGLEQEANDIEAQQIAEAEAQKIPNMSQDGTPNFLSLIHI